MEILTVPTGPKSTWGLKDLVDINRKALRQQVAPLKLPDGTPYLPVEILYDARAVDSSWHPFLPILEKATITTVPDFDIQAVFPSGNFYFGAGFDPATGDRIT